MKDLVYSTYNLERNRQQNIRSAIEHVSIAIASIVVALVLCAEYVPT